MLPARACEKANKMYLYLIFLMSFRCLFLQSSLDFDQRQLGNWKTKIWIISSDSRQERNYNQVLGRLFCLKMQKK